MLFLELIKPKNHELNIDLSIQLEAVFCCCKSGILPSVILCHPEESSIEEGSKKEITKYVPLMF